LALRKLELKKRLVKLSTELRDFYNEDWLKHAPLMTVTATPPINRLAAPSEEYVKQEKEVLKRFNEYDSKAGAGWSSL
jgi:hypothetical protein